jgi:hypothetical protein
MTMAKPTPGSLFALEPQSAQPCAGRFKDMAQSADLYLDPSVLRHGGGPIKAGRGDGMRDLTVLRQIVAHLDGWSDLRTQVVTEDISWPSVHVARGRSGTGSQLWQCAGTRWTGQLFDDRGVVGQPVATIQTTIGEDASASEVADGIKAIYRAMRTEQEPG